MIQIIAAFLCGILVAIMVVAAVLLSWLYSQSHPSIESTEEKPYIRPQLPQELQDYLMEVNEEDGCLHAQIETCHWFNLIVAFVFNELRDSVVVKRFVMKKINKEFEELMFTKTEGRMIEQLTVRDYFLGTSLPIIQSARVVKVVGCVPENSQMEEMDIILEVEYTGKFEIAIDADLVFNKAAYVALEVSRVSGTGRLRFSRSKETHWSFAFIKDPILELKVNSHFEGRRYPQLSSLIKSQIRKWVKRKHTLPAYKVRYKPFFRKIKPQNQLLDVFVHDQKLTVGKLAVSVVECCRLPEVEGAVSVYCTLSVASLPWEPVLHLWKTQWPVHEILIREGKAEETIGIHYRMVSQQEEGDLIVVSEVVDPSAAYTAGVKKGDVLTRVNNVKVTSVRQSRRLIKKFKDGKNILLTVQRPPAHFSSYLLDSLSSSRRSMATRVATVPIPAATVDVTDSHPLSDILDESVETTLPSDIVTELTGADTGANTGASYQAQAVSRKRSNTTPVTSELLAESHPVTRMSYTPISSEDERDGITLGRFRRGGGAESDTMSLHSVRGELGGEEEASSGEQHHLRKRLHPLLHSQPHIVTDEAIKGSASQLSPTLSSSPSSSQPVLTPGDMVDTGGMSAKVEDIGTTLTSERIPRTNSSPKTSVEHLNQKHTKAVPACKNPAWHQRFKFDVGDHDHYLNISVWQKLNNETGDLLIGHVTVHLMDIAMECFHTKSGRHEQRYVLVPGQPAKALRSRTAVQATAAASGMSVKKKISLKAEERTFVGDIMLKFRHSPKVADEENTTGAVRVQSEITDHHQNVPSQGKVPSCHNFVVTESTGIQKCDICQKMIWTIKLSGPYMCQNCGLKCHKKCLDYCMKEVPCCRKSAGATSESEDLVELSTGDLSCGEPEKNLEQKEFLDQPCHRHCDSFEVLEGPDDGSEYDTAEDDVVMIEQELVGHKGQTLREQTDMEYILQQKQVGIEEFMELHGHTDEDSSDMDQVIPDSEGELSSKFEVDMKLKWSGHLPPDKRESAITKKLLTLGSEIDKIQEIIDAVSSDLQEPSLTTPKKKRLENEIERYNEKMAPLELLRDEMMAELSHCMSEHK